MFLYSKRRKKKKKKMGRKIGNEASSFCPFHSHLHPTSTDLKPRPASRAADSKKNTQVSRIIPSIHFLTSQIFIIFFLFLSCLFAGDFPARGREAKNGRRKKKKRKKKGEKRGDSVFLESGGKTLDYLFCFRIDPGRFGSGSSLDRGYPNNE